MPTPRHLQVTPFTDLSGANRVMLTLLAEQVRRGDCALFALGEGPVTVEARKLGARVITAFAPGQTPLSKVKRWSGVINALVRAVESEDARIIHVHSAIGNHYTWPAKWLTGAKVVCHQHDTYRRDYFHFGLAGADRIIAVSNWVRNSLPPRHATRTTVLWNAVCVPPEQLARRRTSSVLTVGMAGRCTRDKGHDLFLDAVLSLMPRYDFNVEIWGLNDGPWAQYIRRRVADAGPLASRFRLEGFRPDMENFYAAVDIVAMPSRVTEAFGLMAAEAMAWYRGVVAASIGGIPEMVVEGETGLLFAPEDAGGLTAQLERLIADPSLRNRLAETGRRRVAESLDPPRLADAVEGIYRELIPA